MAEIGKAMERLAEIMRRLRAPDGCPWDKEQTLKSLRPYLVEETYEVLDEMDRVVAGGSWRPLAEELGDLLFQIVFHAHLATEQGQFTLADVANAIADKLERRHPHVFGNTDVADAQQVLQNWAKLKAEERKAKTGHVGSVLDGVPSGAPALQRAERLTEKASRVGFDWPDIAGVRAKIEEEFQELGEALEQHDAAAVEHELGDVLFALANLGRKLNLPPEDALRLANQRFTRRFHAVEAKLTNANIPFGEATLAQMDLFWSEAKAEEKARAGGPESEVTLTRPVEGR
jgi:ATP diphosphatase